MSSLFMWFISFIRSEGHEDIYKICFDEIYDGIITSTEQYFKGKNGVKPDFRFIIGTYNGGMKSG